MVSESRRVSGAPSNGRHKVFRFRPSQAHEHALYSNIGPTNALYKCNRSCSLTCCLRNQRVHMEYNECTRRTITWTQRCMSVRSPDDTGKTRRTDFASRQDFTLLAPSNVWKFCRPIFLKITISARRNENIITFYNGQLEKNCTIAKKYVNSKNLIRFKKVAIQNKCPAGNWDICFLLRDVEHTAKLQDCPTECGTYHMYVAIISYACVLNYSPTDEEQQQDRNNPFRFMYYSFDILYYFGTIN